MKALKDRYENAPAVGTCALGNWGGLEVLDIIYSIDDYAIACFNFGDGRKHIRKHKIYTSPAGSVYIRKGGSRYYFNDTPNASNIIMRV